MRESAKARQAWADYLALGDGRSLEALLNRYQSEPKPITRRLATLKSWSRQFGWQLRLEQLADQAAAAAAVEVQRRRTAAMETGLALDFERVGTLKTLAATLLQELTEGGRLWLPDAKWIGGADYGEKVEIERFNAKELEQLRGLLDDIAKEKGERAKKIDVVVSLREEALRLATELGIEREQALREVEALLAERHG